MDLATIRLATTRLSLRWADGASTAGAKLHTRGPVGCGTVAQRPLHEWRQLLRPDVPVSAGVQAGRLSLPWPLPCMAIRDQSQRAVFRIFWVLG